MTRNPTQHHGTMALLMALALAGATVDAADWPRFLGPDGNSIARDTGINTNWAAKPPRELWRTPMPDGGFSGPAVAAGLVYLHDHEKDQDVVRALNLADGQERWRFAFDEPGADNHGTTRATPTVHNGVVYTISRYGTVHALAADTGAVRWSTNAFKAHGGRTPEWNLAASTVVDGDRLLITVGAADALIVALDLNTGSEIWKGGPDAKPGYATPVIAELDGKRQYLVFSSDALFGIDAASGAALWTLPWKTQYGVNAGAPIALDAQHVWIATGYRKGAALVKVAGGSAETVWTAPLISPHWGSAVRSGGYLYVSTAPGELVCLDEKTGVVHDVALKVLVQGLIDLRILRGSVQSNIERDAYRPYFMHGTSHWLGLDVHDAGIYRTNGKSTPLVPGMVLTVEPGLYLSHDAPRVPKRLQGIGIRIEDDILVTPSGRRNLSGAIPSTVEALEELVGSGA